MSMLSKLSALFRGSAHEAGQAVVDKNALRILDQEIRDADNAQSKARDDLAGLVARRRSAENELQSLGDQIATGRAKCQADADRGRTERGVEHVGAGRGHESAPSRRRRAISASCSEVTFSSVSGSWVRRCSRRSSISSAERPAARTR